MTEQASHNDFNWKKCEEHLANRSPMEKYYETMIAASNELVKDLLEDNKMLKNERDYEKAKNEYLAKVMKQYGIPVPDFSMGIPIIIPPNMPKQRRNSNTKEKHQGLLGKDGNFNLPKILNTQRAQTYFKMALEKGYMKTEGDHFCWLGVNVKGRKSQLAYFCGRIYDYQNSTLGNTGQNFPEEELNNLFQEKELYKLLPQIYTAKKMQGWRTILDSMFES